MEIQLTLSLHLIGATFYVHNPISGVPADGDLITIDPPCMGVLVSALLLGCNVGFL